MARFDRDRLIFCAILGLGAVLRGIEAFRRPLQVDEALMVAEARLPIRDGLASIAADVHPPLILLLLRPLEMFNCPDVVPRMLMLVFGLGSIALVYAIVRLWADPVAALLAMTCAAAMPTISHYDTWIRMYAPLSTMELLGWYSLSLLMRSPALSVRARGGLWALWVLSSTAAVYLHYLGWVSLAAQVLWIVFRVRGAVAKAALCVAAVATLWLPQLPTFLSQMSHGGRSWSYALGHPATAIMLIPGDALLHPEGPFEIDPLHVAALIGVVCAFGAVLLYARDGALPWLGLAAVLTVVMSLIAHLSLYRDRYFLLFAYAVCIWIGVGLKRVWDLNRSFRLVTAGALAALAAFAGVLALDRYYYTADWPAVAEYLQTRTSPGQPFIAEQSSSFLALTHYATLAGHKLFGVDAGGSAAAGAVRYAEQSDDVWLILFEASAVDPNEDLVKGLTRYMEPVGFVRFTRASASESVLVAEFRRRGF